MSPSALDLDQSILSRTHPNWIQQHDDMKPRKSKCLQVQGRQDRGPINRPSVTCTAQFFPSSTNHKKASLPNLPSERLLLPSCYCAHPSQGARKVARPHLQLIIGEAVQEATNRKQREAHTPEDLRAQNEARRAGWVTRPLPGSRQHLALRDSPPCHELIAAASTKRQSAAVTPDIKFCRENTRPRPCEHRCAGTTG